MGVREFYFSSTDYSILETWTTYLEFLRAKAIYDDFVSSFGKISFPLNNNDRFDEGGTGNNNRMNLSRMTQALENNRTSTYKTPNLQRKNTLSTSRKMTVMKGVNKQILLNTMQEVMASNANQENAKKLKERLVNFFWSGQKLFLSHILEAGSNNSSIVLGQTTQILRKIPLNIEENLLDDVKIGGVKPTITDSQDLAGNNNSNLKNSFELQDYEQNHIDMSQSNSNKTEKNDKKKSLSGEDSIILNTSNINNVNNDPNKVLNNQLLDIIRSKSNLEMIKEVEENHSLLASVSTEKEKEKEKNNQNTQSVAENTLKIVGMKPSRFAIEEKKKIDPVSPYVNNKHRGTLEEFDDDIILTPFKMESAKPSTLLTRQELDNLQLIPQEFKESTEELLEQIGPVTSDSIQVKLQGGSKLNEANEGKSCDFLINETVMISKKPHIKKGYQEISNFMDGYKEFEDFRMESYNVAPKKSIYNVISRNDDDFKESVHNGSVHNQEKVEIMKNYKKKSSFNERSSEENVEDERENNEEKMKRVPKVMMRMERKKNEEKNSNNDDFLQKLPFRMFPQTKPKIQKIEEQNNMNYGHINFHRKV